MTQFPEHDEHIIEAIGKVRVVIRNGRVAEVGEPVISRCPLAKRFARPVPEITREAVKANIEGRIRAFGMCTPDREIFDRREFVGFGASEMLSFAVKTGRIDAAVIACDGAGTVVVTDPAMIQGIGGKMSGLVSTTPIPEIVRMITDGGGIVIDPLTAKIDQVSGVQRACDEGYSRIGVTLAGPEEAAAIRKRFPGTLIIAVHTTGLTREEAESLGSSCDLVTACASGTIRETASSKALLQAGISVPVFAMTPEGKDLILDKIRESPEQVLVKPTRLPSLGGEQPDPLV